MSFPHPRSSRITSPGKSGIILLDKPEGITSFNVLNTIKRVLDTGKVGHAGTLDKFATGLLIVCTGWCTKLIPLLVGLIKRYSATLRFGTETDTLDPEGEEIARAPVPTCERVMEELPAFLGKTMQVPPVYSAIHVDGKRAYKMARAKKPVDLPARQVQILKLEVQSCTMPELSLEIVCSKGTYIRSLARDLGRAAESAAFLTGLRRTAIGDFYVVDAVRPADFNPDLSMLPAIDVLRQHLDIPILRAKDAAVAAVTHGVPIDDGFFIDIPRSDGRFGICDDDNRLLAIADKSHSTYKYMMVVPND